MTHALAATEFEFKNESFQALTNFLTQEPIDISCVATPKREVSADSELEAIMLGSVRGESGQLRVEHLGSMARGLSRLRAEVRDHSEWFDELDLLDADVCPQSDLRTLLSTAPTDYLRGYIFGKLSIRMQMAEITGRDVVPSDSKTDEIAISIQNQLTRLMAQFPEFGAAMDDNDPDICSIDELQELMQLAPAGLAQGLLFGKLSLRMHRSFVQGL